MMFPLLVALLMTQTRALPSLITAEHAFARTARIRGAHTAFLGVLHPEGLIFQPRPLSGIQAHSGKEEDGSLLFWYPALAQVSSAGDLGYTTGPWEYRDPSDAPPSAQGWFVTVWIRDGAGPWQLLLDMGSANPVPPSLPPALPDPSAATIGSVPPHFPAGDKVLLQEDQSFARDAAVRGLAAAYRDRLASAARIHRRGHFPATGSAALDLVRRETHTWRPEASRMAASGDLGFTHGTCLLEDKETGAYLRIWKKGAKRWQLVLEVVTPY